MSQTMIREARLADAAAIARVHVDAWRESYRGIVPDRVLGGLAYGERERQRVQALSHPESGVRRFTLVAEEPGGEIVGFAAGGPERAGEIAFDGEIYAIYLLEAHKRRGLGRALVRALVQRLTGAGMRSAIVWVLRDNLRARAFYEALGGALVGEKSVEMGGAALLELAYGWPELPTDAVGAAEAKAPPA